jgi:enamine deaminase RidA (YjgF/YER057c/UK114 family)
MASIGWAHSTHALLNSFKGAKMSNRLNVSSGIKWEDIIGYSRAVRVGNVIEVAGTTALDEAGDLVGTDNPYEQTKYIIIKIEKALLTAGATLKDIVRTRIFTTDISRWEEIGRAHGEFFSKIKPASTMVEVKALINPAMLVEIEATVILQENQ